MEHTYHDIEMGKKEPEAPRKKPAKQGPIPERTHWILRKMIRQRHAELCESAPAKPAQPSGWPHS
jgi:hypothetical protein